MIGVGVLAFKPDDFAPRMPFLACFGLTLTAAISAIGNGAS